MNRFWLFLLILVALAIVPISYEKPGVRVGSKKFTENVIVGELITDAVRSQGVNAKHYRELGGTRLVFNALVKGDIDTYPEYTGTMIEETFADQHIETAAQLTAALADQGIAMTKPLGFNNKYAIGMLKSRAQQLGISKISDLSRHPDLKFGFSNEFIDRDDGWKSLKKHYGLDFQNVQGLDHDIAYRQLASGSLDAIDVYSTDAKIKSMDLAVLQDDRQFFPRYDAVVLYRQDLAKRYPKAVPAIQKLVGKISDQQMIEMNLKVEGVDRETETRVAGEFLAEQLGLDVQINQPESVIMSILKRTVEHLDLVRRSLIPAILLGIPFGIIAYRFRIAGQVLLGVVGIFQTIPALALLVLVMPLVAILGARSIGEGSLSAVIALFLYSLLPIVRNTYAGFQGIENQYKESAQALGLSKRYTLFHIEMPLAMRSILAGIKTAAVMNVGFAALGGLIGAGGYGQPIMTGIRLDSMSLILQGAIPAALMAVVVQLLFELVERWVVPKGLRLRPAD
jgi:osmoprotectant transport system permease protein